MMKKSIAIIVGVIVVIVIAVVVVLLIMNKPASTPTASQTDTSSSNQAPAVNNAVVKTVDTSAIGAYLTDANGNTLYTYGNDTTGVSTCTGSCLQNWPAYIDSGSTTGLPTDISTLTRSDNSTVQYTYKGLPLYTFASDSNGQATGNGVSGFILATP